MSLSKSQSLALYELGQENDESPCALFRSGNRLETYYGICGVVLQHISGGKQAASTHGLGYLRHLSIFEVP
jgi:hypothetical protein